LLDNANRKQDGRRGRLRHRSTQEVERRYFRAFEAGRTITVKEIQAAIESGPSGTPISERTIQNIVRKLKDRLSEPGNVFLTEAWIRWDLERDSTDGLGDLISLDFISWELAGRGLYEHEAKWAGRLRDPLFDLTPLLRWFLVRQYSEREAEAKTFDEDLSTDDLDPLIGITPWRCKSKNSWDRWIKRGDPIYMWVADFVGVLNFPDQDSAAKNHQFTRWAVLSLTNPTALPVSLRNDDAGKRFAWADMGHQSVDESDSEALAEADLGFLMITGWLYQPKGREPFARAKYGSVLEAESD
jgi:hypothetical protein